MNLFFSAATVCWQRFCFISIFNWFFILLLFICTKYWLELVLKAPLLKQKQASSRTKIHFIRMVSKLLHWQTSFIIFSQSCFGTLSAHIFRDSHSFLAGNFNILSVYLFIFAYFLNGNCFGNHPIFHFETIISGTRKKNNFFYLSCHHE
jgi:hypothetical protein